MCGAVLDPLAAFCLFSSTCHFLLTLLLGFCQERREGALLKCTRCRAETWRRLPSPSSSSRVSCLAAVLRGSKAQRGPTPCSWQAPLLLRAVAEVTGWPLPEWPWGMFRWISAHVFARKKLLCYHNDNKRIVREEVTF